MAGSSSASVRILQTSIVSIPVPLTISLVTTIPTQDSGSRTAGGGRRRRAAGSGDLSLLLTDKETKEAGGTAKESCLLPLSCPFERPMFHLTFCPKYFAESPLTEGSRRGTCQKPGSQRERPLRLS